MKELPITSIAGFAFGHADDAEAGTGCTIVLCEQGARAGVSVRGGSPGTRETDALQSENLIDQVHGVFLSGGSAFGLDAGSGVMDELEKRGVGFDVEVTKVPIVPGAILFDLMVGDGKVRPDQQMGRDATQNALQGLPFLQGNVGAGTGASVGKLLGPSFVMKGGIGHYAVEVGELKMGAVIAVNSFGDIVDPLTGERIAGAYDREKQCFVDSERALVEHMNKTETNRFSGNTTIGIITCNAMLSKPQANKLASIAHDGFARTIKPSHTFVDGDTLFAMTTNEVRVDLNALSSLACYVVERAVVQAVKSAVSAYNLLSYFDIKRGR
ncbi:P1 family peptidase [Halobacillus shinanisalinarum]|uniref:P1 family peptidase n=1 Tax=Halobacillus shinanisalinarum TaxID=2932258 RepID=A0ABY4GZ83_9BACI|nr:P1 family peptidase [Halobacillus shinanisalinarum]UOQ93505.1 P1 family peptidase [Halobacillus shinanisalinarum]